MRVVEVRLAVRVEVTLLQESVGMVMRRWWS